MSVISTCIEANRFVCPLAINLSFSTDGFLSKKCLTFPSTWFLTSHRRRRSQRPLPMVQERKWGTEVSRQPLPFLF